MRSRSLVAWIAAIVVAVLHVLAFGVLLLFLVLNNMSVLCESSIEAEVARCQSRKATEQGLFILGLFFCAGSLFLLPSKVYDWLKPRINQPSKE